MNKEELKEKTVEINLICEGEEDELIEIPIELFTRIEYMARCENTTFEELFVKILKEEIDAKPDQVK